MDKINLNPSDINTNQNQTNQNTTNPITNSGIISPKDSFKIIKQLNRKVTFDNNNENIEEENSEEEYEEEIQTRKRINTKKSLINSQETNNLFKSNESILDFLSQAKSICDDYEKEIELLRRKITDSKKFNCNILRIANEENKISYEAITDTKDNFIDKLTELSKEATPDFNMLNQVYSEKIQELFVENEKLNIKIKSHNSEEDKIKDLEKEIEELKFKVKDKEVYIENMNGKRYFFIIFNRDLC